MAFESAPSFRILHALKVKGFSTVGALAELSGLPEASIEAELQSLLAGGHAQFREARQLWQITPAGKEAHATQLAADLAGAGAQVDGVRSQYPGFLEHNEFFKGLCGDWQLVNGQPNDHSDAKYDAKQIARLANMDAEAQAIITAMGASMTRYAPYPERLTTALAAVQGGNHKLFTGVMCSSYHDVWMELHEDLIVTLGIDRAQEGSF
jgi:hypothetical protein